MSARIDHLVTSGTFSLDGGTWEVDNNVWIVGDNERVVVIDPAHDADAIEDAVGSRVVMAILLTHAHDDHVAAVDEVAKRLGRPPIYLNPHDEVLWGLVHAEFKPDAEIHDGDVIEIAGLTIRAIATPGHSPGSTCFFVSEGLSPAGLPGVVSVKDTAEVPVLFSGDTLFQGGPGATGRSYSDFDTIIESIRTKLFALPDETVVLTGHGDSTTIGEEKPDLEEWIKRGS